MTVDFEKIITSALAKVLPGALRAALQATPPTELGVVEIEPDANAGMNFPQGGSTPSPTPTPITREQVGAALLAAAKEKGRDPIAAILKQFSLLPTGVLDGVPPAQYSALLKAIADARAT